MQPADGSDAISYLHVKRLASLDLLRGLSAFAVAIPHFFVYHQTNAATLEAFSAIAVEIFFVLSGFVLAPQILICLERGTPADLGVFLVRRWMRTIPPYSVALLLVSVLFGQVLTRDFLRYLLYVQNLFSLALSNDYFPVAWSLSVEEWFYICFPSALLMLSWISKRRGPAFCMVGGLAFITAISIARAILGPTENWGAEVRRVVAFRIDSIAYGFFWYLLLWRLPILQISAGRFLNGRFSRQRAGILSVCLVVGAGSAFELCREILVNNFWSKRLFPFAAALFGILIIQCFNQIDSYIRESRVIASISLFLGRISYSVYLFHLIVMVLLSLNMPNAPIGLLFPAYLIGIVGFSTVFFHWFEKPILAARPDYRRLDMPKISIALAPQ